MVLRQLSESQLLIKLFSPLTWKMKVIGEREQDRRLRIKEMLH
jgi:hypothetical protein